jgi:hypothetical protein
MANDWIVYGQTTMAASTGVDNPTPNSNGLNGEQTSCLASVGPSTASYYVTGMRWSIPAGKVVNVRLLNGTTENNVVCSWMVQGQLEAS